MSSQPINLTKAGTGTGHRRIERLIAGRSPNGERIIHLMRVASIVPGQSKVAEDHFAEQTPPAVANERLASKSYLSSRPESSHRLQFVLYCW